MKTSKEKSKQTTELVLVSDDLLRSVVKNQEKILEKLKQGVSHPIGPKLVADKFISEAEAKKLLHKGTTWFWQRRKNGRLSAKKVGSSNFYAIEDILKFIEEGGINA